MSQDDDAVSPRRRPSEERDAAARSLYTHAASIVKTILENSSYLSHVQLLAVVKPHAPSQEWTQRELARSSAGPLRVRRVDPGADQAWKAFVARHPSGLIYHHPAWSQALEREYGQTSTGLVCEDADGTLLGVFPLLPTRGLPFARGALTGRRLSSLPRTPVCGPLVVDERAKTALLGAAVEQVRQDPKMRLQLKVSSQSLDGLVDGVVGVPWRRSYVLELPARPDEIRFGNSRNHRRIRYSVRKAERLGVRVRHAETKEDLRAWYSLYLQSLRRHAVPPRPYRFFEALWELMHPGGMMQLLLADAPGPDGRRLLAGSIFLRFGATVSYAFNGRSLVTEDSALRPDDVIQWHAIHRACRDGFRWYDLGEVAEGQEGLHAFKSKWGAEPRRLYRYYYPALEQEEIREPEGAGWPRVLAQAAWRRLPLALTVALGDRIYRYL
jgi:CelD/BcsL family acetyltransferase involved in cellulose biosynthesis